MTDSNSSGRLDAQRTYSSEKVLNGVTGVTRSTAWQRGITAKRNDYATTSFSKYTVVHGKRLESESETFAIVGSLEPYV